MLGICTRHHLVADKTFEYLYREIVSQDRYVAHGLVSKASFYLLLRRRNERYLGGQWDIPGGTVEDGETSEDAAVRECFEETGFSAQCGV